MASRSIPRPAPPKPSKHDIHHLYSAAVQEPSAEADFFDQVYKAKHRTLPTLLGEDFCSTAQICAHWVGRRSANVAIGLDIDPDPLKWHNRYLSPTLTCDQRSRLHLVQADVLAPPTKGPAAQQLEVLAALNFSYWIFDTRAKLLEYFKTARSRLTPGGIFVLDFFGGSDVHKELVERRRRAGFTYVWEQAEYNPVTGRYVCHISFELPGGKKIKRAFTYHWRLWTLPELCDILSDAGFGRVTTYLEREDRQGNGTGVYKPSTKCRADRCFLAYITADD